MSRHIYRVYSDPTGSDQRIVVAGDEAMAISAVDLVDRSSAKCVYIRRAEKKHTRDSFHSWVFADAIAYTKENAQ